MRHDLAIALRQFRKTPAFTAVAILSLALGIGANTAVFSLVNEFLLQALPVKNPGELLLFRAVHGASGPMRRRGEGPGSIDPATGRSSGTPLPLLVFERFKAADSGLAAVFAYSPFSRVHVMVDGIPEVASSAQYVSGGYYGGLGVAPRLGRTIAEADDRASAPPVAVLSHRFWERRFGGREDVLGRTIHINRVAATIVGVTAAGFDGAMQAGETADVSVPLAHHVLFQPDRADRVEPWYWWLRVMGRVAPGSGPQQVRAALEPVLQQAAREGWLAGQARLGLTGAMPELPSLEADAGGQGENDVRRQYARSLGVTMGLVLLVLVAACANVATLLVARGQGRRREMALRLALGSGRSRLVRQLLVEAALLSACGALLGIALAWWGRALLPALQPFGNTAVILDLPLDARVLGFTLAASVITTFVFGLAPALRATRLDLTTEFQGGRGSLGARRGGRLGHGFLVLQVALSLVLLVATGLFIRTVDNLQAVEAGFDVSRLALFTIDATSAGYAPARFASLHERIEERVRQLPGVSGATFSRVALLARARQNMNVAIPGNEPPPGQSRNVHTNGVSPSFFGVMNLPVLAGRGFADRDTDEAPNVAVVNETFVRQYFPGENPIGRELLFNAPILDGRVGIVGIARDAKYTDLRTPIPPTVYFPARQLDEGVAAFAVRTSGEPASIFPAIQAAVREIDPTLPVLNLRTQSEQIDRVHGQERLFARLSGAFGLTALALALVGLYGLLSHEVLRRRNEIGLRLAVGAPPARVLGMVVRESLTVTSLGIAAGLVTAWASSRFVASMLFGVSTHDPATYGAVALLLLSTSVAAAAIPAVRASRTQPAETLRSE